jgi:hypothetical protein
MGGFLLEAKALQPHRHSRWLFVPRATALGTAAKATIEALLLAGWSQAVLF